MAYVQQLFQNGDLVAYVPDLERRVYRVKGNPIFQYGDWWYNFHQTAQGGGPGNHSEQRLPQAQLTHANAAGDPWGTRSVNT